jgi:hypothetical protein
MTITKEKLASKHLEIERNNRLLRRLEKIEDWLMDNPFNHPEFEKKVEERNNLLIRIK